MNKKIFFLLLFFSSIPYLGYLYISFIQMEPIIGSYSYNKGFSVPSYIYYTKFIKDILLITFVLGYFIRIVLRQKVKKSVLKALLAILFFFCWGIFGLMVSNLISVGMITSGARWLLYYLAGFIYILEYFNRHDIKKVLGIVKITLFLNLISTILQIIVLYKVYTFTIGYSRLTGLFEGSGNLGTYAVSTSLLLFVLKIKNEKVKGVKFFILISLLLAVLSGTRTAMVLCGVLMIMVIKKPTVGNKYFEVFKLIPVFIVLPLFLMISNEIAGRGNAIESNLNKGRFTYVIEYLQAQDLLTILVGKGLGFGTNAAFSLVSQWDLSNTISIILDGTYNMIISQFGLLGLLISLILSVLLIIKIFQEPTIYLVNKFVIILVLLTITFIGNILESYVFIYFTFITMGLLLTKEE